MRLKHLKESMVVRQIFAIILIVVFCGCTGCGRQSQTLFSNNSQTKKQEVEVVNNEIEPDVGEQDGGVVYIGNGSDNTYEEEESVIGENDYNSVLTESVVRWGLEVPDYAVISIEYSIPGYDNETGEDDICAVVYENGIKVAAGRFSIESGQPTGKKAYLYQPPETNAYAEPDEDYGEPQSDEYSNLDHYQSILDELDEQIEDLQYYPEDYYKRCDNLLNEVYQDIKGDLSDSSFKELKESELSWLDEREQIASNSDNYWESMSYQTIDRIRWLMTNYAEYVD